MNLMYVTFCISVYLSYTRRYILIGGSDTLINTVVDILFVCTQNICIMCITYCCRNFFMLKMYLVFYSSVYCWPGWIFAILYSQN